ncbi:hypothetical protein Tco_0626026 [Tanacetum coccineum]|uniref:Zinc finger, CCHC-type n=1 Tax=Tanacetum coccineum TaxID=301880 RepID=A0ABQ4WIL6_9ASTR
MAHSDNNALSSAFKTFFERETLTGPNFNEWHRSLRIVLRVADTYDYLYKPCPDQPPETATAEEKAAWKAEYKKHSDVACIMLGKMSPALQRQFENYPPQNMLAELRKMFEKPPAVEIYDLVDTLHSCKQAPGKSVSEHVLEMKGLMDQLHTLGKPYDNDMAVNLINRGVVSLSCLLDLGFHHTIASNGISVSLNGIFYFGAISVNGVFEIDMNNNVPKNNNNSIFSINKKRKLDLDSWSVDINRIQESSNGLLLNIF